MANRNLFRWTLILSLFTLICLGNVSAADNKLPAYYPSSFQHEGILRDIGTKGTLIVSGNRYTLSPNALIHSLVTQHSSRFALKEGLEVGFTANRDTGVITEIWILPKGSVKEA